MHKLARTQEKEGDMRQEQVAELKRQIRQKDKTIKGFCRDLGIAESTFYRKAKNREGGFTLTEAARMAQLLGLTPEEAAGLFF